jgi:hypothetical protein
MWRVPPPSRQVLHTPRPESVRATCDQRNQACHDAACCLDDFLEGVHMDESESAAQHRLRSIGERSASEAFRSTKPNLCVAEGHRQKTRGNSCVQLRPVLNASLVGGLEEARATATGDTWSGVVSGAAWHHAHPHARPVLTRHNSTHRSRERLLVVGHFWRTHAYCMVAPSGYGVVQVSC